jgi:hypothetical protein
MDSPSVFQGSPPLLESNDLLSAQVLNLGSADLLFIAEGSSLITNGADSDLFVRIPPLMM